MLLDKLYEHSPETFRHSMRVGEDMYNFARFLQLKDSEQVFLLGCLHDIGKIQIPKKILYKKSALNEQEYELIKRHAEFGAEIIKEIKTFPREYADVVRYHHENEDGSGYYRLEGTQIPYLSKMIRIVDSVDTIIFGRNYQEPLNMAHAMKELVELSNIYYHSSLVQRYLLYLQDKEKREDSKNFVLKQLLKNDTISV